MSIVSNATKCATSAVGVPDAAQGIRYQLLNSQTFPLVMVVDAFTGILRVEIIVSLTIVPAGVAPNAMIISYK